VSSARPVTVREALEAARRAGLDFPTVWFAVLETVEDERWREALSQTSNT
jgi:hypothetical protein